MSASLPAIQRGERPQLAGVRPPRHCSANANYRPQVADHERLLSGRPLIWRAFAEALLRQIHLLQESLISWVSFELLQRCLAFDTTKIRILLRIGAFQPFECVI